MKKILVVTDKLYPDEIGGSCTYAYETVMEIQKHIIVDIFTCYPEKKSNDKMFSGKVYRYFNKRNPIKSSLSLLKCLKNNKYEVIIFHSVYSWIIYYLIKFFVKNNLKQIAIYHGPWHKEAKSKYISKGQNLRALFLASIMKFIEWLYGNDNSNFIFLSNYMRNELLEINRRVKEKSYKIIPGGVNSSNYIRKFSKEEAKKILNIENEKFVIFILRRLEHRMGIQNAIKAVDKLENKKRANSILLIGGKGNYKEKLEDISKECSVECRFLGFVPDEDINLYFCASDLFLVPSIDLEGFGLVNLESLSMGVPVLATPQGGMVELNNLFENFYLCNGLDVEDITSALDKIYDIVRGKVASEKNIKNYSWSNITKMILEYIIGVN